MRELIINHIIEIKTDTHNFRTTSFDGFLVFGYPISDFDFNLLNGTPDNILLEVYQEILKVFYNKDITPMTEARLEYVIKNLFTKRCSKKEILEALSWGEKHTDIYFPLMKQHQPKYYCEGFGNPIQSFVLLEDFNF